MAEPPGGESLDSLGQAGYVGFGLGDELTDPIGGFRQAVRVDLQFVSGQAGPEQVQMGFSAGVGAEQEGVVETRLEEAGSVRADLPFQLVGEEGQLVLSVEFLPIRDADVSPVGRAVAVQSALFFQRVRSTDDFALLHFEHLGVAGHLVMAVAARARREADGAGEPRGYALVRPVVHRLGQRLAVDAPCVVGPGVVPLQVHFAGVLLVAQGAPVAGREAGFRSARGQVFQFRTVHEERVPSPVGVRFVHEEGGHLVRQEAVQRGFRAIGDAVRPFLEVTDHLLHAYRVGS